MYECDGDSTIDRHASTAITTNFNGQYFCDGIQLRERVMVPKWLGNFLLWVFFRRLDTRTYVTLSGFSDGKLNKFN